jgi:hypothetical protein
MTIELKDWMNSINFNKRNLMEEDPSCTKDYAPYIVNKVLSAEIDCIMFANEMNIYHQLDKDMQYSFYLHSIRKRKRFSPWLKKTKIEDLECVKKYYGYSNEKAIQALKILTKKQLQFIRDRLETGGKS